MTRSREPMLSPFEFFSIQLHGASAILGICMFIVFFWVKFSIEMIFVQKQEVLNGMPLIGVLAFVCGAAGFYTGARDPVSIKNRNLAHRIAQVTWVLELVLLYLSISSVAPLFTPYESLAFEQDILRQAALHPKQWIELQDYFPCCGFRNTTGPFATGAICPSNLPRDMNRHLGGQVRGPSPSLGGGTCRVALLEKATRSHLGLCTVDLLIAIFTGLAWLCLSYPVYYWWHHNRHYFQRHQYELVPPESSW
eukprot:TRINITY_DN5198_c0_g1_i1.p1 TRINITY_DN5198_c0_g1~~TRINITY_DN5198_c0_g1_i1.p1  ORF type:complete len:251 (-),score=11.58 TRINITY_DN5198_c0_g1_i1:189-941(-)